MPSSTRPPRVLALSSSGGHWVQLLRLRPGFEGCDVAFATTRPSYAKEVEGHRFHVVRDANRTHRVKLILCALSVLKVLLKEWPDVVVSTGALPGFCAIWLGRLLGRRTIWVDSIANAEELSLCGSKVKGGAQLWLTQWEHLAKPGGPQFRGNVLGD